MGSERRSSAASVARLGGASDTGDGRCATDATEVSQSVLNWLNPYSAYKSTPAQHLAPGFDEREQRSHSFDLSSIQRPLIRRRDSNDSESDSEKSESDVGSLTLSESNRTLRSYSHEQYNSEVRRPSRIEHFSALFR